MTFERTTDAALVETILTNPRCYRIMTGDDAPAREQFRVTDSERFIAVLCRMDDGMLAGVFVLFPTHPHVAEVHFCFLPSSWGRTEEGGKAFLAWVWRETSLNTLIGPVPGYNALALALAKRCGFREVRTEHNAVTKGGKMYDLVITKVDRPS